jgi:cyclopropane-fatty-acyl-phospholipid synthase
MGSRFREIAVEILQLAGVNISGANSWDVRVQNEDFYRRAITEGELGIGESYMDGWWDSEHVDETIFRILRARLDEKIRRKLAIAVKLSMARLFNLQSRRRAFMVGERHYDLGNDLFQNMLDNRMNYSCGYWKDARDLNEAQEKKLELICRKLYLKPGMRMLDIGCGWGAFGKYAAERYKVEVVGITVSKNQVALGRELCSGSPVEFRLMDYRRLDGTFDRIVSVGMMEHVGYRNYRTFFKVANKCLNDDGLFLLHTIGRERSASSVDLWTNKYIFPNGMLPSVAQLGRAIEGLFIVEDWHNLGSDYDKTLMAWHKNFTENWIKIKDSYSERFFRMWTYFLLSSAGAFRARRNQLWQIILSKNGVLPAYVSIR